jgi:hypothetical protein
MTDAFAFSKYCEARFDDFCDKHRANWEEVSRWYKAQTGVTYLESLHQAIHLMVKISMLGRMRDAKNDFNIHTAAERYWLEYEKTWYDFELFLFRKRKAAGEKSYWYFHDFINVMRSVLLVAQDVERWNQMMTYKETDNTFSCSICRHKKFRHSACHFHSSTYVNYPVDDVNCWREQPGYSWDGVPEVNWVYDHSDKHPFSRKNSEKMSVDSVRRKRYVL